MLRIRQTENPSKLLPLPKQYLKTFWVETKHINCRNETITELWYTNKRGEVICEINGVPKITPYKMMPYIIIPTYQG